MSLTHRSSSIIMRSDEHLVQVTVRVNGSIAATKGQLNRLMAASTDLINMMFIPELDRLTKGTSPGISPEVTSYQFQSSAAGNVVSFEIEVHAAKSVESSSIYELIIANVVPMLSSLGSTAVIPKPERPVAGPHRISEMIREALQQHPDFACSDSGGILSGHVSVHTVDLGKMRDDGSLDLGPLYAMIDKDPRPLWNSYSR